MADEYVCARCGHAGEDHVWPELQNGWDQSCCADGCDCDDYEPPA